MTMLRGLARAGLVVGAALLAAGCGGGGDADEGPPVEVNTKNDDAMDGVSDAQLQQQAVPMTPEEAAARGIVDTTIHLENLGSQDTTPAGAANNDTAAKSAAPPPPAVDTARTQ